MMMKIFSMFNISKEDECLITFIILDELHSDLY